MPIRVILEASSSRQLVLTHYASDEECHPHRHGRAQISLLLAGGYVEDSEEGRAHADGPSLSRKPVGFEHQNRFGECGALILSVNIDAAAAPEGYFAPAIVCGPAALRRMAAGELPTLAESGPTGFPPAEPTPRPWLIEARTRLLADSGLSIGELAASFGQHPVRFARLFRQAFARSPTAVRQDRRAARAVGRLIRSGAPLAEIAAAEGFADQAHLSRAVSQATGWSPGRLRRLFIAA